MYWACARTEVRREAVAARYLGLNGYEVYLPKVRAQRRVGVLFPNYLFFAVETRWHSARWSVGVCALLMEGERPAKVPDAIISEIRSREGRNGLVELPSKLKRNDVVRIKRGPFAEQLALYQEQAPHERVAVLLSIFNSRQRVVMARGDVEAI